MQRIPHHNLGPYLNVSIPHMAINIREKKKKTMKELLRREKEGGEKNKLI